MNYKYKHIITIIIYLLTRFSSSMTAMPSDEGLIHIKGKPRISHYSKEDFQSDQQFWSMTEDNDGIQYFGNSQELLIFDGKEWRHLKFPNESAVRSVYCSSENKVYAAGYDEFGLVEKDSLGQYRYRSLVGLLAEPYRGFKNIWQIQQLQEYIILRSFSLLIVLNGSKTIALPSVDRYSQISVINDHLYVSDNLGFKELDLNTTTFTQIIDADDYNNEEICKILPGRDSSELIAFTKEGHSILIYPDQKKSTIYKDHIGVASNDQIFSALKTKTGQFYLGTINNHIKSLDIFSDTGEQKIDYLQDKTVLNLYESKNGNVWALLNKGIDCIEKAFPMTIIFEDASVYDAVEYNNRIYLATNQGVYFSEIERNATSSELTEFKILDGLEAQAWKFTIIDDKLFVGHDLGVFVIDKHEYYHVSNTKGIWKIMPIHNNRNEYLAYSYSNFQILKTRNDGKVEIKHDAIDHNIAGRALLSTEDPRTYWAPNVKGGVVKIKFSEDYTKISSLEHYTEQNGLPSKYNISIFPYQSDMVFLTKQGVYEFNLDSNKFFPHKRLNSIFKPGSRLQRLKQSDKRTWFLQDGSLGYFNHNESNPSLNKDQFISLNGTFIKTMGLIIPRGEEHVWVGTTDGLFQFDLNYVPETIQHQTVIREISYKLGTDSIIYAPISSTTDHNTIFPYNINSMTFKYANPKLSISTQLEFSYILEGNDENWSEWSDKAYKEYSLLKSGSYEFKVKARGILGEKSIETSYRFTILPVWYQTRLAISLFILLGAILIGLVTYMVKRKIKKTKKEEHKLRRVLELELEQVKLEKEKEKIVRDNELLEEVVIHKSKELTNYTILLLKKRELLTEMSKELQELKDTIKQPQTREKVRSLLRQVNINLQDEEHLHVFDANFERVHQAFFNELKTNFPDLIQKELRMCGFVKMNMTNKEIASILNISVRGVETARYRLRKKMSLSQEVNMVEFLEKLSDTKIENELDDSEGI